MASIKLSPLCATAENVAAEEKISRQEQDQMTLLRHEQYQQSLANDREFQRRYLLPVTQRKGKKVLGEVTADEGVFPTTAEGLAKLRPVVEGGTVTFGTQTHPADGNAGIVVCSAEQASRLGRDSKITPITPMGQDTLYSSNPASSSVARSV